MPHKVLMPALSPTMTEGKLAKWHKSEGDTVEAGDVIAEIETDKATMEVEAVDEGTLARILVEEGTDNVAVNNLIAVILEEGEDESDLEALLANDDAPDGGDKKEEDNKAEGKPEQAGTSKDEGKAEKPAAQKSIAVSTGDRVFASPLARRLAKEAGIDLAQVKGSGPRGRIVKADIEKAKKEGVPSGAPATATAAAAPAMAPSGPGAKEIADAFGIPYNAEQNNNVRKVIARRLLESKQTVPHYYLSIDCELDELLALRKKLNDQADGEFKLSVNDFIVKATALALKKVPQANSSWTEDAVLYYERADVSVAVATENGLITPIVKDADNKSVKVISNEVKDLAGRARENKLSPEEFQGGTCTVSNLGMYGIKEFGAIINPPQSAIVAVGAGEQRPVVHDGELAVATVMSVTGSFDHRSVDGAVGAQFLTAFKNLIENPMSLLL